MIQGLFPKKLKEIENLSTTQIKQKVSVQNLIVGLMFVPIVKTDIKIVPLSNLYMIQK